MQIDPGSRLPFAELQSLLHRGPARPADVSRSQFHANASPVHAASSWSSGLQAVDRPGSVDRLVPSVVRAVDQDMFAAALVSRSASMREETALSLELTTAEGDVVSLEFRQLDYSAMRADADGFSAEAGLERFVSLSVTGELSDAELSAIDGMVARVAEEASSLLQGDPGAAARRLASLGFDSDTLASFSLNFRQATWQSMSSMYMTGPGARLTDLARRDEGVASLLDGMASMQRRLIDEAMALFDTVDAARLGRSIVPAVFSFAAEPKQTQA